MVDADGLPHCPCLHLILQGPARAGAHPHGQRTYGHRSYTELANDPEVQVIYIATPASAHKENMLLCLSAGKAVLCEKPFTVNAEEAKEVIGLARRK